MMILVWSKYKRLLIYNANACRTPLKWSGGICDEQVTALAGDGHANGNSQPDGDTHQELAGEVERDSAANGAHVAAGLCHSPGQVVESRFHGCHPAIF
ncbi:hypothetical protein EN751_21550 [Mesorhizobium sp. M4A.F.Ca.ET.029.04.2.1]|uniref:hypothetical protein n=1 Tax=Mesorhizobium sp. TaxID=1871066 RepID=UPI000FD52553|nr:hypothetical protein [Mesorhizobium sp.]RVD70281.1 hypothetical protein EN751_21550 [Mesorhizobium sp. M4A.F.Ca.ET.029.04.2.1]